MELLTPTDWTDYELIDTGNREKLERFGRYILIRPEPQAVWEKAMPAEEWEKLHHARFARGKPESPQSAVGSQQLAVGSKSSPSHKNPASGIRHPVSKEDRGEWIRKPAMPDQWMIGYNYKEMQLKFRLGLTAFGHIGVFPEQAENWKFAYDKIQLAAGSRQLAGNSSRNSGHIEQNPASDIRYPASGIRILNLFAYTGGASLAAKAAGADVVHVDSVKQVINWAREDMEVSNLDGIRWVIEDAIKFVRREVKRGNRYDGIILDPPAYGRGPDGEKWILEDSINEMISLCSELLSPQSSVGSPQLAVGNPQSSVHSPKSPFLILSLYSMGFSSLIGENLVRSHFKNIGELQSGELCFTDRAGRNLPLGTVTRFF